VKEHNKNRLELITGRYAARRREKQSDGGRTFEEGFRAVREAVIRPVLEEIAAALGNAGHAARVTRDEATETPSIELVLGIRGAKALAGSDVVGFSVIRRRDAPEILAYLIVKPPPMDLIRFAAPAEITPEQVEQIAIDAVEHIFACHSV
jgi:hypothetical protein